MEIVNLFKESTMSRAKKMLARCLGIGLASYIGAAAAAENGVLFKIHDIVPVKNADGIVVSCDLGATFYNRTGAEVSNAALTLVWSDEVVADAINQEERKAREARRTNRRNTPRYNTASYNSKDISLNLRLPPIKPHQQISLKSKVMTDRCFLLLNDMEVTVTKCGTAASNEELSKIGCDNLFRFVSPKSPEYYSEFKEVSPDELAAQEDNLNNIKKMEVIDLYNSTLATIENISQSAREDVSAAPAEQPQPSEGGQQ